MVNVCVDFGHNSMKGATSRREVLIPSVLGEVKRLFLPDLSGKNGVDYLQIRYQDREYFFGDLARRQSDLKIQNVNNEDMNEYETKVMILATAAYLAEQQNLNLVTSLPLTHYRDKPNANRFADSFKGKHKFGFYDFEKGEYQEKEIQVQEVDVKPQGFLALMSLLLGKDGRIAEEIKKVAGSLIVVIDPGYYSTEVYISNALEPIVRIPVQPIPGMSAAYKILADYLFEEFNIRKELHEVEEYARSRRITVGNREYDISEAVDMAYSQLTKKIVSEVNNLIPFWSEVNYWLLAGGGAQPLYEEFKVRYKEVQIIPSPQMANAKGGLLWSRRLWK